MNKVLLVVILAWYATFVYAFVLRERAQKHRVHLEDSPAEPHGAFTTEGQRLLARARLWSRISIDVPLVSGFIVVVMYAVEASRGRESWGLPAGGVLLLVAALLFERTDITAPTQRVWRGWGDGLGFALRPMRNRVALAVWLVGMLIMVISAG